MTRKKDSLKRGLKKLHSQGPLQRIGKRKHRLIHALFWVATVGGYLAGDYAQDGVIDGSLLQSMLPYLQAMI